MNKIPTQQYQGYSENNANSYRLAMMGGGEFSIGGGENAALQTWMRQAQSYKTMYVQYLQKLSQGGIDAIERSAFQTVNGYLSQLNGWLSDYGMGGGWDPLSGNFDEEGFGANGNMGEGVSNSPSFPIAWQDQNHIVTDEGADFSYTVSQNDPETRAIDAYQENGTIEIPSASAQVKVTEQKDEMGKPMKVVKITFANGKTREIRFHGENLTIQSAKTKNVVVDASVISGVTVEDLGSKNDSDALMGDQPTTRKDGKKGYDGASAEIYGGGKDKELWVSLRNEANFHASSNTEFWTVEWDAGKKQYLIQVYSDAEHKNLTNTYHLDDMTSLKASFDVDPSHIEFKGTLGTGEGNHEINTDDPHGAKLSFEGADKTDSKSATSKSAGDTQPDEGSVKGGKATYSKNKDVDLHADFDDKKIQDSTIIAPGTVTLHADYTDNVLITRSGEAPNFIYNITVSKDGKGPHKTYTIKGPPSKILIDALPANVTFASKEDDKVVQIGNEAPRPSTEIPADKLVENVPTGGYGSSEKDALVLAGYIEEALKTGNWDSVSSFRMSPTLDADAIRKVMTALFKLAGSDPETFKVFLQKIPADIRQNWVQVLTSWNPDPSYRQAGDQWNNAVTASKINASLE